MRAQVDLMRLLATDVRVHVRFSHSLLEKVLFLSNVQGHHLVPLFRQASQLRRLHFDVVQPPFAQPHRSIVDHDRADFTHEPQLAL